MGIRPLYLFSHTPYAGVHHIPILQTQFFTPSIDFTRYDGLVVTSKQILEALRPYTGWEHLPIIAISEATARHFRNAGHTVIATAKGYGVQLEPLIQEHGGKWLYCRPKVVATTWREGIVDQVILYETQCNDRIETIQIEENAIMIFTSPSSVACFLAKASFLPTHTVIVIGKTTQKALPLGVPSIVSDVTSVQSCVEKGEELSVLQS
jgi:uroporphyrinogen-III synthase